jgi:hypothetical protein
LLGSASPVELELLQTWQGNLGGIRDLQLLETELRRWSAGLRGERKKAAESLCAELNRQVEERIRNFQLQEA